jgi:tetratricopeptide (TPR) repeat protein
MVSAAVLPPQTLAQLQAASQQMQSGRPAEGKALLEQVLRVAPRSADALHLYGASLRQLGDPASAERPVRQAIAVDKRQPAFHVTLGDILQQLGLPDKAEASYRAALALNRRFLPAARQLALLLTAAGRPEDALKVTTPVFAAGPVVELGLLSAHAGALKAVGRLEEALTVYQKAAEVAPANAVADHNLAAALGDLARHAEAEAAARRALAKGLDAPETRVVQARALSGLGRFDEAEALFETAVRQRPLYADAQRDLAQLIRMRTENKARATAFIDAALQAEPRAAGLRQLKAKVLTFAGDAAGADAVLQDAVARHPDDARLLMSAVQAAIEVGDAERALAAAERVRALSPPGDDDAAMIRCEALIAMGRADEAAGLAEETARRPSHRQQALAFLFTAWRMLGDERYRTLYDYDAFVRSWTIEPPKGWTHLSDYLGDLTSALNAQHRLKTHPLDQSLRHGSQLSRLERSDDPVIRTFKEAVDAPIRAHMDALGKARDPLRSRNTGRYGFQGAWSVKLRPGGGRHVDHLHPEGWLSSACYIDLPKAVEGEGRQGWIKFGQPGAPTGGQPLPPEHYVKPEPGLLVLFPSYMWHGTMPFEGEDSRLTVAFDLVPEKR